MKPKSSYKIENINDYLQAYEQYQKGNYKYGIIKSEEDIVKAYKNGKKIVFTRKRSGLEKPLIWIGIGLFILPVIITVIVIVAGFIHFDIVSFSIALSILGAFGASFCLPNFIILKRLPRSFFVLGREGIVYRRIWGDIRSYSREELDLKIFTVKTLSFFEVEIHMILPNGAKLKFKTEKYHLDEFLSLDNLVEQKVSEKYLNAFLEAFIMKGNLTSCLVGMTFKYYFDSGKQTQFPTQRIKELLRTLSDISQEQELFKKMHDSEAKMSSYDYTFKILILGDASSGKEELIRRYISKNFIQDLKLTLGVDFYSKTITLKEKKIKMQFWPIGGEERFRFLIPTYCIGSNGAIILYDITNQTSLDHLPDWTQVIREQAGDIPIVLIGNKFNLEKAREVSEGEIIKIVEKYNLNGFAEISTKTGENVKETFEYLAEILLGS